MWPHFVWPLCMYSCAYFGLSRWLSWKRICLQCGRPGFDPCAHFTSPSCFLSFWCVCLCVQEREPQREREKEGERGWMGNDCVNVDRGRKPDLTASCWRGHRGSVGFRFVSFYTLSKWPPWALYKHRRSGWERLAYIQGWQRGTGDTVLAWEPLFSPQEVSSNEVCLCQSSSCFFFFHPGENKLACQRKTGEPTRSKAAVLGHELEGLSPGQQVGPSFCLPCGGPTGMPCEAVGVQGQDPSLSSRGLHCVGRRHTWSVRVGYN